MKMRLEKARICLECDTIHDMQSCPECGSSAFYYLSNWVKPARPQPPEREKRTEPRPVAGKKSHWLRNTLLAGAGVVAAYQLLFKPSRKKPVDEDQETAGDA